MSNDKLAVREAILSPAQIEQFKMALPSMITPDRFVRVALTALNKTPKLADCTPASVCTCLLDCAQLGIEPDGRRAHLIPYKDKCTLIIDYKGMVELGRRSGELIDWYAEIVCDNDFFEYCNGQVTHKIDFRKERGDAFCAYSCAIFKDGNKSFCVMTKEEILSVRDRSQAYIYAARNNRKDIPWCTDEKEMWKKTCIRRHSKTLPLSAEFRDAMEKDFDSLIPVVEPQPEIRRPQPKQADNVEVSEPINESTPEPEPESNTELSGRKISDKQAKLIFAKSKGKGIETDDLKMLTYDICGVEHSKDVPVEAMDAILKAIEDWSSEPVEAVEDYGDAYEDQLPLD